VLLPHWLFSPESMTPYSLTATSHHALLPSGPPQKCLQQGYLILTSPARPARHQSVFHLGCPTTAASLSSPMTTLSDSTGIFSQHHTGPSRALMALTVLSLETHFPLVRHTSEPSYGPFILVLPADSFSYHHLSRDPQGSA
jgi:hypothetical protein